MSTTTVNISANQVKELREKPGAPMMDCKHALTEAKGDLEQAVVVVQGDRHGRCRRVEGQQEHARQVTRMPSARARPARRADASGPA